MKRSIVYRCEDGAREALRVMDGGGSVMQAQYAFEKESGVELPYRNKSDFKSLCYAYLDIAEKYRHAEQQDEESGNV